MAETKARLRPPALIAILVAALLVGLALLEFSDWTGRRRPSPDRSPVPVAVPPTGPFLGVNYSHHDNSPTCSLQDSGIVASYDRPGVREKVRGQLATMRGAGVETLRLILWHGPAVEGQRWGVVEASDDGLAEPYRTNLVRYVTDVRVAGFARLTVALAPGGRANPKSVDFLPPELERNWNVLVAVRTLLKQFGPRDSAVDLLNEGPAGPRDTDAVRDATRSYLGEMYQRYARRWGTADVSVSVVASQSGPDLVARLDLLLDAVTDAQAPAPSWFELHLAYDPELALSILGAADDFLSERGMRQPFVVGEAAYESHEVGEAIARFRDRSARQVLEVLAWPLTRDKPCLDISIAPPYQVEAYRQALRPEALAGAPPTT